MAMASFWKDTVSKPYDTAEALTAWGGKVGTPPVPDGTFVKRFCVAALPSPSG